MSQHLQFALDIGTRKILGLCYEGVGKGIRIVASVRREHPDRAMLYGQIQDVSAVAAVIRAVVAELEAQTGQKLRSARVAAAGRALRTSVGRARLHVGGYATISEEQVKQLQWEAVADAQARMLDALASEERAHGYYCVGYSVVRNWMDGTLIGALTGQRGKKFELEVLATFLPRTVVDSLDAALTAAELELGGLSLEPIAALEAIVPKTMRHLNVCLVDIGAGTSDIALTRDGAVFAYAMIPRAGDSITEAISRQWLLDFPVAEKVKRQARPGRDVKFTDILGNKQALGYDEYVDGIAPAVDSLAESIAATVLEWNGTPPDAVMLVGGGSLTPGLAGRVAKWLGLSEDRVAVRDRKAVQGVAGKGLTGPDSVTPLGIALLAQEGTNLPMVRVQVNERWVRLFQPGAITVAEALRAAGHSLREILNAYGPGITVTLNNKVVAVPGRRGRPGKITVNGEIVSPDHVVNDNDEIWAEPAQPGPAPAPTVAQIMAMDDDTSKMEQAYMTWAGERRAIPLLAFVNGERSDFARTVADRDVIEVRRCVNVAEMRLADPDGPWDTPGTFHCIVNGQPVHVPPPDGAGVKLMISGRPGDERTPIAPGAVVEPVLDAPPGWPTLYEVLPFAEQEALPFVAAGAADTQRSGKRLVLLVNGKEAQFTTPLQPGDVVEIRWEPHHEHNNP